MLLDFRFMFAVWVFCIWFDFVFLYGCWSCLLVIWWVALTCGFSLLYEHSVFGFRLLGCVALVGWCWWVFLADRWFVFGDCGLVLVFVCCGNSVFWVSGLRWLVFGS